MAKTTTRLLQRPRPIQRLRLYKRARGKVRLGTRNKYEMREKVEGARDESEIRGKSERMRVSTETKAKTKALDIEKRGLRPRQRK